MDFRKLLVEKIEENKSVTGYKTKLARAANCQLSYLLQVINGQARLSLDQAYELCVFWEFDTIDTEIYMISVYLDRVKNPNLRKYYLEKIEALQKMKAPNQETGE